MWLFIILYTVVKHYQMGGDSGDYIDLEIVIAILPIIFFIHFSAHGTFIGRIRLESKKPQQVPIDSEIHFGASTRIYIIRERPQPMSGQVTDDKDKRGEDLEGSLLGLPETETELDVRFHMEIPKWGFIWGTL